jgi:hypothetical protein
MKPGDRAFFYHSNEEGDRRSSVVKDFYGPSDQSGKLGMVDVKPVMPVAVRSGCRPGNPELSGYRCWAVRPRSVRSAKANGR